MDDIPTALEIQSGSNSPNVERLPTLILIHPGAGMSACYTRLSFHPQRRVLAVNQTWLCGHNSEDGSTSEKFESIGEAASRYLEYLELQGWLDEELDWQKRFDRRAVAFGGWSYGGIVALEMANQVSGGHAPWRRPLLQDYSGVLLFDAVHPVGIYDMQPVTRASAADSAILASAPIQLKQDSDLLNYLRTCYADAQRILRSYEPSPLTLQGPITLIKAGKASPTDRSLSNASRIQRIKTHLCPYNGWKKLAEQPGVKWLTIPLANTAHDNLFIEPHLGRVQAAIDEIELAQRI